MQHKADPSNAFGLTSEGFVKKKSNWSKSCHTDIWEELQSCIFHPTSFHKIVGQLSFKKCTELDLNTQIQAVKIRVNDTTHLQHLKNRRGEHSGAFLQQILSFSWQSLPRTGHTLPTGQQWKNPCFLVQYSIDSLGLFHIFSHILEHASKAN